jgi:hypothetical protein
MSQYVLCSKSLASTCLHMFFSVSCLNLGSHWPSELRGIHCKAFPWDWVRFSHWSWRIAEPPSQSWASFPCSLLSWGGSCWSPRAGCFRLEILVVSVFWGYPNSWMVYNGKSYSSGWFRDTPVLGNLHIELDGLKRKRKYLSESIHPEQDSLELRLHMVGLQNICIG